MLEQKLYEYADRFEENFPIFFFRGWGEDKIVQKIDKCLESGKPFNDIEIPNDVFI